MGLPDALNIMGPMTVGADRSELDQSLFEKGSAMDALHVFLVGHLPVDVVLNDDMHIFVAGGTGQGDILPVDGGLEVRGGPDVVFSMAVPALGHFLDSSFKISPAVDAIRVRERRGVHPCFAAFTVAGGCAVDIRQVFFVRQVFFCFSGVNVVAVGAGGPAVGRAKKIVLVHLEFVADAGLRPVAGQAFGILGWGFFLAGQKANPKNQKGEKTAVCFSHR
jgi:hypothetical protein